MVEKDIRKEDKIISLEKEIQRLKARCENLIEEKENAIRLSKQKTLFLANISHEIRTPLNTILGFSELLSKNNNTPEERKEFSNCIYEDGRMLLNLINDVIDIAKIESDQLDIKTMICDLNRTLKEIQSTFVKNLSKLKKGNIEIILNIPKRQPIIYIDTLRLRQILFNLITNALKFTNEGSIEFGYTFDVREKNDEQKTIIKFFVKDTGIGIPDDIGNSIFEKFNQVKSVTSKEFGSTGLGLSIAKRLATLLDGDIWYESIINTGTIFYFSIPFVPVMEDTKKTETIKKLESFDYSGKRFLIAEDDRANFQLLQSIFKKVNAKLEWAKDGQEAIDIIKKDPEFDMIIMDIQMPNVSGTEATKVIKAINSSIPVIALTAFAQTEYEEDINIIEYDGFYTKPITPTKFLNYINKHINSSVNKQS